MSYTAMVIEAVINLADRYGSSIQAIRKYVTSNFALKQQQTASFNSLTLKALNKAVAVDVLEYDKRLYRLSNNEKERRKEKERALKAAANAQSREALNMVCTPHIRNLHPSMESNIIFTRQSRFSAALQEGCLESQRSGRSGRGGSGLQRSPAAELLRHRRRVQQEPSQGTAQRAQQARPLLAGENAHSEALSHRKGELM